MTIRLGVNIDHVATLRQARRASEPDPIAAAVLAELGGADGITIHLREDRRHIQDRDLHLLRQTIATRLNLEMAAVEEMVRIAVEIRPDEATLVPERRQELTTEGGLDLVTHEAAVHKAICRLQELGIYVSLFIDPDPRQIEMAKVLGADAVEIQTARYAEATLRRGTGSKPDRTLWRHEYNALREAARLARSHGLCVHMGHGLNYRNVVPIAGIPEVEELNIGHSIVARAVLVGMERAVREMKEILARARGGRDQPTPSLP